MTDTAPDGRTAAPYVLRELRSGSLVYELERALPAVACSDMIERFERNIA
jgi:hypothetical protein